MKTSLESLLSDTFIGKKLTSIEYRNIEENYLQIITDVTLDLYNPDEIRLTLTLENGCEYVCSAFTEIEVL